MRALVVRRTVKMQKRTLARRGAELLRAMRLWASSVLHHSSSTRPVSLPFFKEAPTRPGRTEEQAFGAMAANNLAERSLIYHKLFN